MLPALLLQEVAPEVAASSWLTLAERYGPTFAVLFFLLLGVVGLLFGLLRWGKPWADRLIQSHLDLVKSLGESTEHVAQDLRETRNSQEQLSRAYTETASRHEDLLRELRASHSELAVALNTLATEVKVSREARTPFPTPPRAYGSGGG